MGITCKEQEAYLWWFRKNKTMVGDSLGWNMSLPCYLTSSCVIDRFQTEKVTSLQSSLCHNCLIRLIVSKMMSQKCQVNVVSCPSIGSLLKCQVLCNWIYWDSNFSMNKTNTSASFRVLFCTSYHVYLTTDRRWENKHKSKTLLFQGIHISKVLKWQLSAVKFVFWEWDCYYLDIGYVYSCLHV